MSHSFIVYTHHDMESVIQEGHRPEETFLCLPPQAPATMGMGMIWGFLNFLEKNYPTWTDRLVVNCGPNAGYVMSALRHGIKHCIFTGPIDVLKKLEDMAKEMGVWVDY